MTIKNRPNFISALIASVGDMDNDGTFSASEVSSETIRSWTRRGWVSIESDGDTANLTKSGKSAVERWIA